MGVRCKIGSHSYICDGVTIEDWAFVGHGVMFTNDLLPRATVDGELQSPDDWELIRTHVRKGASIGSGASVSRGGTIGVEAMVGAGAVVTKDMPDFAIVAGNPARVVGDVRNRHE